MDICVISTFWLMCVYSYEYGVQIFESLLLILLYIYSDLGLLDPTGILHWHFWETAMLFFTLAAPAMCVFIFLHIIMNTWYFLWGYFFGYGHPNECECSFTLYFSNE